MRSLIQPGVLKSSGLAAALTAVACWPRIDLWLDSRPHAWSIWLILLWTAFFLWNFVFGWHEKYSHRPVFASKIPNHLWVITTLLGAGTALAVATLLDPTLRKLTPQDYPTNVKMWLAMTLFRLAFDQLFLCFAPLAFFGRLLQRVRPAVIGTVIFVLAVMALKVASSPVPPPHGVIASLAVLHAASTLISAWLYLRGGAVLVWWCALLVELRHLPALL